MEDIRALVIYFIGLFAGILTGVIYSLDDEPTWVKFDGREMILRVEGVKCDTIIRQHLIAENITFVLWTIWRKNFTILIQRSR